MNTLDAIKTKNPGIAPMIELLKARGIPTDQENVYRPELIQGVLSDQNHFVVACLLEQLRSGGILAGSSEATALQISAKSYGDIRLYLRDYHHAQPLANDIYAMMDTRLEHSQIFIFLNDIGNEALAEAYFSLVTAHTPPIRTVKDLIELMRESGVSRDQRTAVYTQDTLGDRIHPSQVFEALIFDWIVALVDARNSTPVEVTEAQRTHFISSFSIYRASTRAVTSSPSEFSPHRHTTSIAPVIGHRGILISASPQRITEERRRLLESVRQYASIKGLTNIAQAIRTRPEVLQGFDPDHLESLYDHIEGYYGDNQQITAEALGSLEQTGDHMQLMAVLYITMHIDPQRQNSRQQLLMEVLLKHDLLQAKIKRQQNTQGIPPPMLAPTSAVPASSPVLVVP